MALIGTGALIGPEEGFALKGYIKCAVPDGAEHNDVHPGMLPSENVSD